MDNRRRHYRSKRVSQTTQRDNIFTKLFANTGGNPEAIEDQEWFLDSPDLRLTRIFSIVLILHIVAVGGILAFKMIDKASGPEASGLAKAATAPNETAVVQKELAGKIGAQNQASSIQNEIEQSRADRYRVIAGDTLSEIAVKLGVSRAALQMANGINAPDEIFPGMWLDVPAGESIGPTTVMDYDKLPEHPVEIQSDPADQINEMVPPLKSGPARAGEGVIYQVQKGDTAWGISQKFGIHHQSLLEYNGITRPELLQEGQYLNIPPIK